MEDFNDILDDSGEDKHENALDNNTAYLLSSSYKWGLVLSVIGFVISGISILGSIYVLFTNLALGLISVFLNAVVLYVFILLYRQTVAVKNPHNIKLSSFAKNYSDSIKIITVCVALIVLFYLIALSYAGLLGARIL